MISTKWKGHVKKAISSLALTTSLLYGQAEAAGRDISSLRVGIAGFANTNKSNNFDYKYSYEIPTQLQKYLDDRIQIILGVDNKRLDGIIKGSYEIEHANNQPSDYIYEEDSNKYLDHIIIRAKYIDLSIRESNPDAKYTSEEITIKGRTDKLDDILKEFANNLLIEIITLDERPSFMRKMFLYGEKPNEGLALRLSTLSVNSENKLIYPTGMGAEIDYRICLTNKICTTFGGGYKLFFTQLENTRNYLSVISLPVSISYNFPIYNSFFIDFDLGVNGLLTNSYLSSDKFKPQARLGSYLELGLEKGSEKSSFFMKLRRHLSGEIDVIHERPENNTSYPVDFRGWEFVFGWRG